MQSIKARPFTLKDMRELLQIFKDENKPENAEIIAFYEKKIKEETVKAIERICNRKAPIF